MHFFIKLGLNLIKMNNLTLLLSTAIFIILSTCVMYFLEPDNFESLLNSFYYVMTTFSTVGYGDYSPVTLTGKMFAVLMYMIGIGLLGVVIGKVVDVFTIIKRKREEGRMTYSKDGHIIIIGWSKKSESAVYEILNSNDTAEVVLVDTLSKSPVDLALDRVHYIQGESTEEETFKQANISQANSVIIFSDDTIHEPSLRDAKTLTTAIVVERLAPAVHTTVEILTEEHISNFSHVNVDEIILSQETISSMAVRSAMYKGITKVYSQLLSRQYGEDIYKLSKKASWLTYKDAFDDLLNQGATLIADGGQLDINRRLNETIPDNAELYVICDKKTYETIR